MFSRLEHLGVLTQANVLDLFSGSGALGLEAISRGARRATLVDSSTAANRCGTANAKNLGVSAQVLVVNDDAIRYSAAMSRSGGVFGSNLRLAPPDTPEAKGAALQAARERAVNLVFLDPPYEFDNERLGQVLANLLRCQLLPQGAVVVVERGTRTEMPTWPQGYLATGEKRYGETIVYYLEVTDGPVLEVSE
jgi:16S rRNA (guanine966-N2)-methyltransferase